MRRFVITILAAMTLSVDAAAAADLPVKAPMYSPAPVYNWTGCYVGGNVGGGWNTISYFDPTNVVSQGTANGSGFVGGGQVG
jgi:outer membrane immunogenic protein